MLQLLPHQQHTQILLRMLDCKHQPQTIPGRFPTRHFPTRCFPTRHFTTKTFPYQDFSLLQTFPYQDVSLPRHFPTKTFPYFRHFPTKTFPYQDVSLQRLFPTKTFPYQDRFIISSESDSYLASVLYRTCSTILHSLQNMHYSTVQRTGRFIQVVQYSRRVTSTDSIIQFSKAVIGDKIADNN